MKQNKLYNIFFPVWLMIYFPPIIFGVLVVNLIIDAFVIIFGLRLNKTNLPIRKVISLILKVWGCGFIADIIGSIILLAASELINMYVWNIWTDLKSLLVHFAIVGLVGIIIYGFNYYLLKKHDINDKACIKIALSMAVITAPWVFIIPTAWMYPGKL